MPDPAELLEAAQWLLDGSGGPVSNARLRRAISTAYYALFHKILRAAALRFMGEGSDQSAGYVLLYRSFDHRRMKQICDDLDKPAMKDMLKRQLGRPALSADMRDFARSFSNLQDARHLADYHPTFNFNPVDAFNLVDTAEFAIAAFDRTVPEEQADILALLMVGARPI